MLLKCHIIDCYNCFLFSVYPPGAMLEMSNGYPNSSSPGLGGSPSPGPPPGHPMHQGKPPAPPNMTPKHSSPAPPRANLRVVIPNPHEEVRNFEVN